MWEDFVVLNDPPIHVVGHSTHTSTISVALDLSPELHVFLLELESCFFKLLVPRPQLLYPQARWGPHIPFDLVIEVVCWGSPSIMDAFDVYLGGTCHETFSRGVMAPPARVRVGGQLRISHEKVMERFRDVFGHPHELSFIGDGGRCAKR